MAKNIRTVQGRSVEDTAAIHNNQYSFAAGSQKVSEVGRRLVPLNADAASPTTNATTPIALPSAGRNIAVYNNSATLYTITFGDSSSVTAQAAGAVDANGNPGIPCKPNDWTYLAAGPRTFVIASNASLLVFLIDDDSYIRQEAAR